MFLIPLFFLPVTSDFFDFQKQALLVFGTLTLLVLWALRSFLERKVTFFTTALDLPVILLAAVSLLSVSLRTPNKIDAFLIPGEAGAILAGGLLYFLITQTVRNKQRSLVSLLSSLLASGVVVSLVSIAASTGILEQTGFLPAFAKLRTFSLVGAPLPTLVFMVVLLPVALFVIWRSYKERKFTLSPLYSLVLAVLFLGVVAVSRVSFLGPLAERPKILPLATGWAVAVETLKVSPLGVGPGNFLTAFNKYRPISYNATDLWNIRFAASSNWYLHLFTELGILGLAVVLFLVWRVFWLGRWLRLVEGSAATKLVNQSIFITIALITLLFLLLPGNLVLIFLFFVFGGLLAVPVARERSVSFVEPRPFVPGAVFAAVLGLGVLVVALFAPIYRAEVTYKRALDAAVESRGKDLYDGVVRAINQSPRVARYHITLSQTNLALVNNLAQKKELTEEERRTVAQLAQQAIEQGKIAVSLNPQLSSNWENLAGIYRALSPIAKGAGDLALATLTQAVALEPMNPVSRISLGGIYFAANKFDEAVREFERAVVVKNDLANAHYNLAVALREGGDIERAIKEMERTFALVKPETQDYELAKAELENLKSKLPKAAGQSGETLQAPAPSPSPLVKPPIELSPEAAPPPTGSPAPTPVR